MKLIENPSLHLMIFTASFFGSCLGIGLGGSMFITAPALLAFGYLPPIVLCTTRPALIAQSIIGLLLFKNNYKESGLSLTMVIGGAISGALLGILLNFFIGFGNRVFMPIAICLLLFILVMFYFVKKFFDKISFCSFGLVKESAYFLSAVAASFVGSVAGAGGGLAATLIGSYALKVDLMRFVYLEKFVTAAYSMTVLIVLLPFGFFDNNVAFDVLLGSIFGSLAGGTVVNIFGRRWVFFVGVLLSLLFLFKVFISIV